MRKVLEITIRLTNRGFVATTEGGFTEVVNLKAPAVERKAPALVPAKTKGKIQ